MTKQREVSKETRDELATRYRLDHEALLSSAVRVVEDADVANDVVHAVFTRLLEYDHNVPRDRLCAYLHRAVQNEALHRVERKRARSSLLATTRSQHFDSSTPDIDAGHRRLGAEIQSSISALPPRCQRVASLVLQRGLTLQEAAASMGISVCTVKEQLRRARRRLKGDLSKSAEVSDWRI
jgi:RNA polymerase sigma-70 factor, ECF subfamily